MITQGLDKAGGVAYLVRCAKDRRTGRVPDAGRKGAAAAGDGAKVAGWWNRRRSARKSVPSS